MSSPLTPEQKSAYEKAALLNKWTRSPAHDGWVNDDFQDHRGYVVARTAEDACFLSGIEPDECRGR